MMMMMMMMMMMNVLQGLGAMWTGWQKLDVNYYV
jgi:hypothetical protein